MQRFQTTEDQEHYTAVCTACGQLWGPNGKVMVQAVVKTAFLHGMGENEENSNGRDPLVGFLANRTDISDMDVVKYAIMIEVSNEDIYKTSGVHLEHLLQIQKIAPSHIVRLRVVPASSHCTISFDLISTLVILRLAPSVSNTALVAAVASSNLQQQLVPASASTWSSIWGAFHKARKASGLDKNAWAAFTENFYDWALGTANALREEEEQNNNLQLTDDTKSVSAKTEHARARVAKRSHSGKPKNLPDVFNDEAGRPVYESANNSADEGDDESDAAPLATKKAKI